MGVCMNDKKNRYWDLFHFVYGSRIEENIIVGPIQFAFQNEDASTIVLLVTKFGAIAFCCSIIYGSFFVCVCIQKKNQIE